MDYIFSYVIIFHGNYDYNSIYVPVLQVESGAVPFDYSSSMHLLDKNMIPALPVIEYVLHLPRVVFDLHNLDELMISASYDTPHVIILLPDSLFLMLYSSGKLQATGIFCTIDCDEAVYECAKKAFTKLGVLKADELNETLLNKQWEILRNYEENKNENTLIIERQKILEFDHLKILPQSFLARQFNKWHEVLETINKSSDIECTCSSIHLKQTTYLNSLLRLRSTVRDISYITKEKFDKLYKQMLLKQRINVVITFPGIPKQQVKYGQRLDYLPIDEQRAIRILGLHRAIAENAVLMELPCVDKRLFEKLNELESFCKNRVNGRMIWRTLREMGKIVDSQLTPLQKQILKRAERISAFTDFPIGFAVLQYSENPLSCYKQISYHSITPLTRALQAEGMKQPQIYLGNHCRVAFIQSILNDRKNELVRQFTELTYEVLHGFSFNNDNFYVEYKECLNVETFKEYINNLKDIDILLIAAHGFYNPKNNAAGLIIGNEEWVGNETQLHVPPVVLLSACHTSPHGSGSVNVADLFLRLGAIAVLGTCIPVEARRNMLIMTRLFTYVLEAQKGSDQYRTLADAWMGVVATNAIHEIADSSTGLKEWLYGNNNGTPRIIDFQTNRCPYRLTADKTYNTTIEILKEMLHEEGMDGKFDNILSQEDYFPESLFYHFVGYPENVFLYNEIFKTYKEQNESSFH